MCCTSAVLGFELPPCHALCGWCIQSKPTIKRTYLQGQVNVCEYVFRVWNDMIRHAGSPARLHKSVKADWGNAIENSQTVMQAGT